MHGSVPVLALGLLLGALALVGGARADGQARAAQAAPAARWEYRVFRLDYADYKDKLDYKDLLQRYGPRAVDAAFEEHVLNALGREGWELVTHERRDKNMAYLYVKRPATGRAGE